VSEAIQNERNFCFAALFKKQENQNYRCSPTQYILMKTFFKNKLSPPSSESLNVLFKNFVKNNFGIKQIKKRPSRVKQRQYFTELKYNFIFSGDISADFSQNKPARMRLKRFSLSLLYLREHFHTSLMFVPNLSSPLLITVANENTTQQIRRFKFNSSCNAVT
jgi:hypothetical protein